MWTQGFSYLRRFISLHLTYLFSCTVGYLHTYTLIVVWYGILQILFPSLIFHAQKYDDCYVYVTMKFSNQRPAISLIWLYNQANHHAFCRNKVCTLMQSIIESLSFDFDPHFCHNICITLFFITRFTWRGISNSCEVISQNCFISAT